MPPFVKLMINETTNELLKKPNVFSLLTLIATRAKRTNGVSINGLEIGEAFIGDYRSCGLTEQKYRTAKKLLEKCRKVNFKSTNKGTVAKLLDNSIFDINPEVPNGQVTDKQRTSNEQTTTNKKERKKEYNNINIIDSSKEESESGLKTIPVESYGRPEINQMLEALKLKIGITDFADSKFERNIAKHCVNLMSKIGKDEFVRRLDSILADNFKRKRANEIIYIYNQIKAYIEPKEDFLTSV